MKTSKGILLSLSAILSFTFYYLSLPLLILAPNVSEAAECTLYETMHPNFPLTGAHLSTGKCSTCASCHAGGKFLGTPKDCVSCHGGSPTSPTVGRSTSHIPISTADCGSCHNTTSFTASWQMRHVSVSNLRCDSCHNGSYTSYGAMGKPNDHIKTTQDCGACHVYRDNSSHSDDAWEMSIADIHRGITTNCASCHNGINAKGKINAPFAHPATSEQCETCHSINNSFYCAP